jgi:hypothetical protein
MVMCNEPEMRQCAKAWHFVFGEVNFLATKWGKRKICNAEIAALCKGAICRHGGAFRGLSI